MIEDIEESIKNNRIEEVDDYIDKYKKMYGYDEVISYIESNFFISFNQYEKALNSIRIGLKCNLFDSNLYYLMGTIYEKLGYINRAYLCYQNGYNYSRDNITTEKIINCINLLDKSIIKVNDFSIILVTYNNLEYTKVCVDSIRRFAYNYEIIIVDNNSTDGTVEWIKNKDDIRYILNKENEGFPKACNQGIELAKKENDIFLLNNDTVIMPNSIFNLRMGLYWDDNVGATGSVSNCVTNYQQISEKYDDFDGYMDYSLKNNITDERRYDRKLKLVGFALMIKRNVLNNVGSLDERFTPGNFEDDDISFRIVSHGYELLLCKDSYIHHFGSVTFKKYNDDFNKLIKLNLSKFKNKWGFSSEYSTIIRYDLLEFIHDERNKNLNVLDIGCSCGATLLELKNRFKNINLHGIEINEHAAKIASKVADIRIQNVENVDFEYRNDFFDYIILGDVLEHLYNPEELLIKIKKHLKTNGNLLISIPNVMHYTVIKDLINGNWSYQDSGILDRTHIRFFTKNEFLNLLHRAGFEEVDIVMVVVDETESDVKFIDEIKTLSNNSNVEDFSAYQYLIKAKKKFDKSVIDKCSRLLRRIEFNVDVEVDKSIILQNIYNNTFTENIIIESVLKNSIKKIEILNYLSIMCYENKVFDLIIPLLNCAYSLNSKDLDTNYNLAYILAEVNEEKLALDYISKLVEKSEEIKELELDIRGRISGK